MEPLTERQEYLLGLIVREYTETAMPVSSKGVVERYHLGISSATVRNEMMALTEKGYLRQPHTSAGREPTEAGYRYFVQRLLGDTELPVQEQRTIAHQFYQARADVDGWMKLAAAVLAHHSRGASLVTAPRLHQVRFKHMELIATHGRMVLMVLVLQGGDVEQQFITLGEPVSQTQLSETAQRLNLLCVGQAAEWIAEAPITHALDHDVALLIAEIMRKSAAGGTSEIFRDGMTNVLAAPEFAEAESARRALRVLEEPAYLEAVLSKTIGPTVGSVQVVIGGEGGWQDLQVCSMVFARYGVADYLTGAMAVLGPQRMAYGRVISTVRFVSGLMSKMLEDNITE